MSQIRHHVHADVDALATAAAQAIEGHLTERIASNGRAVLALTGGSAGVKTAAALAETSANEASANEPPLPPPPPAAAS